MRERITAEKIASEAAAAETWEELRRYVYDLSVTKVGSMLRVDSHGVQRWDYDDGSWLTIRDTSIGGRKYDRRPGWKLAAFDKQAGVQLNARYMSTDEQ